MAVRDAKGKFVKKSRLVVNGVPQQAINVTLAVENYADLATHAPTESGRTFWRTKLWETRIAHNYVSQLETLTVS